MEKRESSQWGLDTARHSAGDWGVCWLVLQILGGAARGRRQGRGARGAGFRFLRLSGQRIMPQCQPYGVFAKPPAPAAWVSAGARGAGFRFLRLSGQRIMPQRQPYGAFAKPPAPAAWVSAGRLGFLGVVLRRCVMHRMSYKILTIL